MKKIIAILFSVFVLSALAGCVGNRLIDDDTKYNQENERFTVVFENSDGTILSCQILRYNEAIVPPKGVTKSDSGKYRYTFLGWDINDDGQKDELPQTAVSSLVARALYSYSIRSYTVTFIVNCDSYDGETQQTVRYGESAAVPTQLQKAGYTFVEWNHSFDYIVRDTVVEAVWSLNRYNIRLHFQLDINYNKNQELVVEGYHGFFGNLVPPNNFRNRYLFLGWKDAEGNLLTNQFGDLYQPLNMSGDIDLYLEYEPVENGKTYGLGRMPYTQITDEPLQKTLRAFAKEQNITDGYFYYNDRYYFAQEGVVRTAYIVPFVAVGIDNFTEMWWDANAAPHVFISQDILYSALPSEVDAALTRYGDEVQPLYQSAKRVSLPYATVKPFYETYPDNSTMEDYYSFLYNHTTQKYETDISANTCVLDTASLAKDNSAFLVSESNETCNVPIHYTDNQGVVGTIDPNTEYGIKIMISIILVTEY